MVLLVDFGISSIIWSRLCLTSIEKSYLLLKSCSLVVRDWHFRASPVYDAGGTYCVLNPDLCDGLGISFDFG